MKRTLLLLYLLFAVLSTSLAHAASIKGLVKDSEGKPMVGVAVVIEKTATGTTTNLNGEYELDAKAGDKILFSFIGMKSTVVIVGSRTQIDITMEEESVQMDDVVAVGYGVQRKSDLSGSVASIKAEDITMGDPSDLAKGLTGKIAGVNVMQNDGSPGGGMSINIRGANSFSTSTQPLYILDGIPYDNSSMPSSEATSGNEQSDSPLSLLNPSDIASIEVLKDASATAIYGSRGANGVVLITTKKGLKGRAKVELSTSYSVSQITKKLDMLGAYDYANYCNEQVENSNYYDGQSNSLPYSGTWSTSTGKYSPSPEDFLNPGVYTNGTYSDIVGVADWQDEIFQTSYKMEYNLRVSGGTDNGNYMISGNYLKQDGVVKNSGFERYTLRANLNRNIRKWLRIGTNLNFGNTTTNIAKTATGSASGILRSALVFPTTYDPQLENSSASEELSWLSGNPTSYVNNVIDDLTTINISTSSYVEADLLPSLKLRQNVGIGYVDKLRITYYDSTTSEGMNTNGLGSQADNFRESYVFETLLTWNKQINKIHRFNVLGGFTAERAEYGSSSMTATDFPNDMTGAYDLGAGLNPKALVTAYGENSLVSFIGRANYTLKDKYIFTATYRMDGSSKFVEENKFADFYSGAVAWRVSEEQFMKGLDWMSNLKLRASIGETGNQGINSYQTYTRMGVNNYSYGGNGLTSGGAIEGNITSDDLKWETTRQYDFGIDLGLFNNIVTLTVDYYNKRTRDLLQTLTIPSSTGYTAMLTNSGNVTNSGVEVELGLNNIFRHSKWNWSVSGNIAFNRNEISGLDADQFAPSLYYGVDNVFIQRNGLSIGTLYGYVEDGFYDNIAEVKADPEYSNLSDTEALKKVGEIKYLDIDGEPGITSGDMTTIGDTNANFTYGLNTSLQYKQFKLSLFFQGSEGNDIFNATLLTQTMSKTKNITQEAYDTRWTEENKENAQWPKATYESTRDMLVSDRFVEDGSYLKLKNVNFEYKFTPKSQKIFSTLTVYANVSNVFTITNYSGYDPEMSSFGTDASRKGVDYYAYPSCRTYTVGAKMLF